MVEGAGVQEPAGGVRGGPTPASTVPGSPASGPALLRVAISPRAQTIAKAPMAISAKCRKRSSTSTPKPVSVNAAKKPMIPITTDNNPRARKRVRAASSICRPNSFVWCP